MEHNPNRYSLHVNYLLVFLNMNFLLVFSEHEFLIGFSEHELHELNE